MIDPISKPDADAKASFVQYFWNSYSSVSVSLDYTNTTRNKNEENNEGITKGTEWSEFRSQRNRYPNARINLESYVETLIF